MFLLFFIFTFFSSHCSEEQQVTLHEFSTDQIQELEEKILVTETYGISWPTKKYEVYEIDHKEYLSLTKIIESNKTVLKTKREIRFCNSTYECLGYHLYDPNVKLCFGQDFIALGRMPTLHRIFMGEEIKTDLRGGVPQDKTEIINSRSISRFLPVFVGLSFIAVLCTILYFNKRK